MVTRGGKIPDTSMRVLRQVRTELPFNPVFHPKEMKACPQDTLTPTLTHTPVHRAKVREAPERPMTGDGKYLTFTNVRGGVLRSLKKELLLLYPPHGGAPMALRCEVRSQTDRLHLTHLTQASPWEPGTEQRCQGRRTF